LQDFVEQAVEARLGTDAPPAVGVDARIAALPDRYRRLPLMFLDLLEMAPEFYLRAIEKHVVGLVAVFRQFDKRYFESQAGAEELQVLGEPAPAPGKGPAGRHKGKVRRAI